MNYDVVGVTWHQLLDVVVKVLHLLHYTCSLQVCIHIVQSLFVFLFRSVT